MTWVWGTCEPIDCCFAAVGGTWRSVELASPLPAEDHAGWIKQLVNAQLTGSLLRARNERGYMCRVTQDRLFIRTCVRACTCAPSRKQTQRGGMWSWGDLHVSRSSSSSEPMSSSVDSDGFPLSLSQCLFQQNTEELVSERSRLNISHHGSERWEKPDACFDGHEIKREAKA